MRLACMTALTVLLAQFTAFGQAVEIDRMIPNEYETVGGYSLALGNMGVASSTGLAAVRVNPALLALERSYAVGGGYNWPMRGRDFYQAGVVDSKSSAVAAGFSYTGFTDDYSNQLQDFEKDSPVKRRFALGLAQPMGLLMAGIGGQFVEAHADPQSKRMIKGTAINIGIAGMLTPMIRFGASVENLANKKIAAYAPRTFRVGVAGLFGGGNVIANFDLRQRDRITQLEQAYNPLFEGDDMGLAEAELEKVKKDDETFEQPERMAFASGSARVYDMLRLLASYGQSIGGPDRKTISGGLAVVSGNFTLSYTASRPYMNEPEAQQAVNAAFSVNL